MGEFRVWLKENVIDRLDGSRERRVIAWTLFGLFLAVAVVPALLRTQSPTPKTRPAIAIQGPTPQPPSSTGGTRPTIGIDVPGPNPVPDPTSLTLHVANGPVSGLHLTITPALSNGATAASVSCNADLSSCTSESLNGVPGATYSVVAVGAWSGPNGTVNVSSSPLTPLVFSGTASTQSASTSSPPPQPSLSMAAAVLNADQLTAHLTAHVLNTPLSNVQFVVNGPNGFSQTVNANSSDGLLWQGETGALPGGSTDVVTATGQQSSGASIGSNDSLQIVVPAPPQPSLTMSAAVLNADLATTHLTAQALNGPLSGVHFVVTGPNAFSGTYDAHVSSDGVTWQADTDALPGGFTYTASAIGRQGSGTTIFSNNTLAWQASTDGVSIKAVDAPPTSSVPAAAVATAPTLLSLGLISPTEETTYQDAVPLTAELSGKVSKVVFKIQRFDPVTHALLPAVSVLPNLVSGTRWSIAYHGLAPGAYQVSEIEATPAAGQMQAFAQRSHFSVAAASAPAPVSAAATSMPASAPERPETTAGNQRMAGEDEFLRGGVSVVQSQDTDVRFFIYGGLVLALVALMLTVAIIRRIRSLPDLEKPGKNG